VKPGFLISQFFITFILLSSLACMVEVGGVFDDSFLAISFFEDFSQAFSLGAVDELVGYDVGECGSEGYAQDDEGGFDAVLHGEHEFIGGQCMDTDDGEEEAVEEDAGDEWDDGRCGQDEYRGMQVACDDQEEE